MQKKYWFIVVLLFLVWLDWYIRAPDSRARELTHAIQLQGSEKLKRYPYQFWVIKVVGETAYLSTPRNFDVPAFKTLAVLFPGLNTKDSNNPEFVAAQQLLGEVQSEAQAIVLAQPGVKAVNWELDRDWVSRHHIDLPAK